MLAFVVVPYCLMLVKSMSRRAFFIESYLPEYGALYDKLPLHAYVSRDHDFTEEDKARRNTIANLLHEWELLDLVDEKKSESPTSPLSQIKIITHKEKGEWTLVAKYTLGKSKRRES